jgi:4-hydroxybenzoate polyprenyltransferase
MGAGMNRRTLLAIWKLNVPFGAWMYLPLWIGAIILGLDGGAAEWGVVALFLATAIIIYSIAEYSNKYSDRGEDRLYWPSNPLVTGELDVRTARNVLILQNVVAGLLLAALLAVTLNWSLIGALIAGWFVGMAYSVPPFRFKETVHGPFVIAVGDALILLVGWLVVAPLSGLVIGFAAFFFVYAIGFGITVKFRKTFRALKDGLIRIEEGSSIYDLNTIGFKLKVKTAMALEAVTTLGAFVMVPVFWHLGIFDMGLSIGLLTLPLVLTIAGLVVRIRDPADSGARCALLIGMAWICIILTLFAVALASVLHWGFAILGCVIVLVGGLVLLRTIQLFGSKAVSARLQEV